jgi:SAM-dependent methyltransferase
VERQKLNLGCGRKHLEDAVNLDITADTGPQVVHDLNCAPWPFPDNRFNEVFAYDVIEHLGDVPQTMMEIWRCTAPGAVVHITVPHFSCMNAFRDPTHQHFFSYRSMDYFTAGHELNFYSSARFEVIHTQLMFLPGLLNKLVGRLAQRFTERYEERWAWIFPAWYLYFKLRTVK